MNKKESNKNNKNNKKENLKNNINYVKNFMQKKIIKIDENKTVYEVCKLMKKHNFRCIPCMNKNKLSGIITSTDIIYNLVLKNKDPKITFAKEIMKKKPLIIDQNTSDIKAAYLLNKHKIKHLLVVDKEKLVGIFTKADMIKHMTKI